MKPQRSPRSFGFTLIELLVAVVVFALAMGLAYGGLNALLGARRQLDTEGRALERLQLTISMLERDVRQAWLRPVRDGYGAPLPALQLRRTGFELTRGGYGSGLQPRRSQLERVGWLLDQGQLVRATWPVLDRSPGSVPNRRVLLNEVRDVSIEALSGSRAWQSEWPPLRAPIEALPLAIRVRIRTAGFGEIERLLELPQAPSP